MSKLFRKKVVDSMATPEQLDTLLRVTNPVAWLALLTALVFTVVATVWAFAGSLAITIDGNGVLMPEGGLRAVPALAAGELTEILVSEGQVIPNDYVVARMKPVTAIEGATNRIELSADQGGRVLQSLARPGQYVSQGQNLIVVARPGAAMECVAYFAFDQGDKLTLGMPVKVMPSNAREDTYGALEGTVSRIEPYPTTREQMQAVLADDQLVDFFLGGGTFEEAPLAVTIRLKRDLSDPSSYRWTSGHGPDRPLRQGTYCRIEAVSEYVRPAELALPKIRKFFGAPGQD